MTPSTKFNSLIASITVSMMFPSVAFLIPLLKKAGVGHPALLAAAGLLASAGAYAALAVALRWLMDRSRHARAIVLGPHYVHGTWIGWFRGHSGALRYMVEHFAQDLDGFVISGRSYTEQRAVHGFWSSESVSVDARRGRLVFTYSFEVVDRSQALTGIHTSLFRRPSLRTAPDAYSGFAHDLNDQQRIAVHSYKISEELLTWDDALERAVQRFDNV
jgi:hypothetical protein